MKLEALLEQPAPDVEVTGLCEDSRRVRAGDAFIAVKGDAHDGLAFAKDAITRGAVAVLTEEEVSDRLSVPVINVPNLSRRRGELAARCYGEPGRAVRCVGVTGTNGKTSVSYYMASMLEALAEPCGYMGTIGWGRTHALADSSMTTAGAVETQSRLAQLKAEGCRWAALEVSSHALAQKRVDAVPFEAAVFTNLSRDHLDYHGSMAEYGAAKRRLFERPGLALGVINADDGFGQTLAQDFRRRFQVLTYGRSAEADVRWEDLRFDVSGVAGTWQTPWGRYHFELPLIGEFSVANAAAAMSTLCGLGFPVERVIDAQRKITGVPGRMEFISLSTGSAAVVDYAHTPDALASVLPALRRHCRGELVCVIGCGGDRDPGKRPLMASVAEELADVIWLTSDNPRSEDPEAIITDMRAGLTGDGCVFECVDRREAIERALACAGPDDVVLVAGKGHEAYQELLDGRVHFSDREVIEQLARLRAG